MMDLREVRSFLVETNNGFCGFLGSRRFRGLNSSCNCALTLLFRDGCLMVFIFVAAAGELLDNRWLVLCGHSN